MTHADSRLAFQLLRDEHGPKRWMTPFLRIAERVSGLTALASLHRELGATADAPAFVRRCLEVLGVGCEVAAGDLERIPGSGAVVVVANHPFGAGEGLVLLDLLLRIRPDVKILGNALLSRLRGLDELLLPVDVFGGRASATSNVRSLRGAMRWLADGHVLAVFPAGEVAHRRRGEKLAADPSWNTDIARIVRRSGARVVPVFFGGENGSVFQVAGRLHPRLRTALLPRALLAMRGTVVHARIGRPVEPESLARLADDRELVDYLRLRTLLLGRRVDAGSARRTQSRVVAIVPPIAPELLATEISQLPDGSRLASGAGFDVFIATAARIPSVLREIGRLREVTFRAVGEGTGRAIDLDAHDTDYLHLFLWDKERREIAGAYRVGPTDRLLARGGRSSLYTSSLFHLATSFLEHVTPGLELGRSFVRIEHQRRPLPLLMLWRGIGAFVVRHPHYHRLFGPVSISADYQPASRQLLVDHLRTHVGAPALEALVTPRRPLRGAEAAPEGLAWTPGMLAELATVSCMVAEVEAGARGVPVLIRSYLELGGRMLGFNVDPAFGDCIDALVLVDLECTDDRRLVRFMGEDGLRRFREARQLARTGVPA